MKRLIVFKSLILATLFLFTALVSCTDDDSNEIETGLTYSELPAKFELVKTWFTENPTLAPTPNANTWVEIKEGNQFEDDHAIGTHYYEIDIDDYINDEKKYDVEFYLSKDLEIIAVIVNDAKVSTNSSDYSVAESQLKKDYKDHVIGAVTWSKQREYQVAVFTATKAQSKSITAWYAVNGQTATREMDSEDFGTTVPEIIKSAFEATEYYTSGLWTIEEIELEHNYNNNGIESYYEMELVNKTGTLEAELFFDAKTGELLYSKEEVDDNNDSDDDKFVVNADLKAAVEKVVPGAKIIEAKMDDNLIEVDAIVTVDGITKEIELKFTVTYELVSNEVETKYTYSTLPAKFDLVKDWFTANPSLAPAPTANIEVEITEGDQNKDDYTIGNYYYEVGIDEYTIEGQEYEVEFYLNKDLTIIAVIVNDKKQP